MSRFRVLLTTIALLAGVVLTPTIAADVLDGCSEATPQGCVTKHVPHKVQKGLTFIDGSVQRLLGLSGRSTLIDRHGNVINEWRIGPFTKFLPGGHVLGGTLHPSDIGFGFDGGNDCLIELDWNSEVVWPPGARVIEVPGAGLACDPTAQGIAIGVDDLGQPITEHHHDVQREGNPVGYFAPGQRARRGTGKTLFLSQSHPPQSETAHISDFPLFNDLVIEAEVDAQGTTHFLWVWDPIDHFDAGQGSPGDLGLGFEGVAREALKTIQVVFNTPPDEDDWLHLNSLSYLGPNRWCRHPRARSCDQRFHPENVIWTSRNANIMAIVARHDHPRGDWKSGDIVWRVGPEFDNAPGKLDQVIGIHHTHMIPRGLPGAGNILVFDNGGTAETGFGAGYGADENGDPTFPDQFRPYSRVIEFDPITLEVVWLYERPDSTPPPGENFAPFFSPFISGAQRLKNGNTLITEGASGRIFEVTRHGELVWEFVNPLGPLPPYGNPELGFLGLGNISYRAYRVPHHWVPR